MPRAVDITKDLALAVVRLGPDRVAELLEVRIIDLPELLQGRGDVPPERHRRLLEASRAAREPAAGG